MDPTVVRTVETSLYFLALINPASKIVLLSSMQPRCSRTGLWAVSIRANTVAWLILIVLCVAGNLVLEVVFHVNLYSLKVAGGVILFIIGLTAVRKGRFYEEDLHGRPGDISIVPLGAPLIAGPGTITAAISFASANGLAITILALTLAILVNLLLMALSFEIGDLLERIHATGPLIRIAGLVVATVAVQMVLSGLGEWAHLAPAALTGGT